MKRWSWILGLVVSVAFAAGWAYGQGTAQPVPQDQPQPGVARISMIRGEVSFQRGDSGDWVAATLNAPLVAGDRVSTGPNSHVELQLDYANILRLSGQSQANIASLDRSHIQLQLAQGLAFYTVFKGNEASAEVDTPNVAIHPLGECEFSVQLSPSGETVVVIRKGEAELSTSQGSTNVRNGKIVTVKGTGTDAQYLIADAPSKDQWDRFNEDRDNEIAGAKSWGRVDAYYTGASDLDAYGRWIYISDYGWVWSPAVASDWAPYRAGTWLWEPYYGWTWVSNEPWGWAPYHYGRWFLWNASWVWWPGPRSYRPTWAPAYVSFFGFGPGRFGLSFGFGFGFGSIGWLPVGPCDPFFPWYGNSGLRFGFADFDRFHDNGFFRGYPGAFGPLSRRFDERFSNFRMAEHEPRLLTGATSIRAEEFGHGMGYGAAGISATDFRGAHAMTGGVPAVPTRQSLASSNRVASRSTIRNESGTRFFSKAPASGTPRPTFSEQASRVQEALRSSRAPSIREGLQREGATPQGVSGLGRGSQSAASIRPPIDNSTRPGNGPTAGSNLREQARGASEGWQRFDRPGGAGASQNNASAPQPYRREAGTTAGARSDRPPVSSGLRAAPSQQNSPIRENPGGWQRFTTRPPESPAQSPSMRGYGSAPQSRYQNSSPYSRGPVLGESSRPSYSAPRYSSRPPLKLSRPIIGGQPRSAPGRGSGYGGSATRGGGGRPSGPPRRR